jgi:hypothetical protein
VALDAAADGFTSWGADGDKDAPTDGQFAFFFQNSEEDTYYEDGDKVSVWAIGDSANNNWTNVKTDDFELIGAASLTAATSVIAAALLF